MDSISQAALGAAIGEAILGKQAGKSGAVIGAILGTVPDLDVLLTPFYSRLQNISIHRGYSHSVLFCIIAAFIFAYILSKIKWTKEVSYLKSWIFSFLALFTHVLLDACTTYGTQMFLPFSDYRVSFDIINIVDPVYTIPLLVGLFFALYFKFNTKQRKNANYLGLGISAAYLLFTFAHKQHIEKQMMVQINANNFQIEKFVSLPVKVGNINWYAAVRDKTHLHIGKYNTIANNEINFHSFLINDHLLNDVDAHLADRMKWFANDIYVVAEQSDTIRFYNLQCDMQGVQQYKGQKVPTAFYFEIVNLKDGDYTLKAAMHPKESD